LLHFFYDDIYWRLGPLYTTRKWLFAIIAQYNYKLQELNYIFTSDEKLLLMNRQYLQHDEYTDILTFNYNAAQEPYLWGEIYISIDRVRENALQNAVSFYDELHRVMIHGVLHLMGYNDQTLEEKAQMRQAEDLALAKRPRR
jgi:probable rRNA maturation factor